MRVLHVNDVVGVASNLVRGLQSMGITTELFQPTTGTYRATRGRRAFLPVIRTAEAFHLRDYVRYGRFDIVHIHYGRFAYLALLTGIPYYLHLHGGDMYFDMKHPIWRPLTILGIRRAKKVIYATPDLQKLIEPIRPDAIFLPNPIDLELFSPIEGVIEKKVPKIFSISKLDRRKGMNFVLRIIELLWQTEKKLQVSLFGFGDATKVLDDFIREHRSDSRLIILPRTPHEQMPGLINSFPMILGQHSLEIGALGISELESMACGKPVVCYYAFPGAYTTPPPVIVTDTPLKACNEIKSLLCNPELCQTIGESSRSWVEKYHKLEVISSKLLEIYSN
jgi:glycosyltransferase involved in cell wall biosynthesis